MTTNRNTIKNIRNCILTLAMSQYFIFNFSGIMLGNFRAIVTGFALLMVFYSIIFDRIKIIEVLIYMVLTIFIMFISYNVGLGADNDGFYAPIIMCYVFSLRNTHPIDILKSISISAWFTLLATFSLYYFGCLQNVVILSDRGTEKISLGFNHPNSLSLIILIVISSRFSLLISNKNNFKNIKSIIWWIITVGLIILSIASGGLAGLVGVAFSSLTLILIWKIKNIKILKIYSIGVFLLSLIFSIITAVMPGIYSSSLNSFFSGRLEYNSLFYHIYGFKNLFGKTILNISGSGAGDYYLFLDNGYLYAIISYGLLFSLIVFLYYIVLMLKSIDKGLEYLLIPLVSFSVLGISQFTVTRLYCYPLLFISILFFSKNEIYRSNTNEKNSYFDTNL